MATELNNKVLDPKTKEPSGTFMVRHFALVSIIVITVIGLIVSYVMTQRMEEIMFKSYANITSSNVKSFISAELTEKDFSTSMKGERLKEFDKFLDERVLNEDILKIKLWNKKGQVIYSDDVRIIGKSFPIKDDLGDALEGQATSEIVETENEEENIFDKNEFDIAIETYVPLSLKGSSEIVGSYEVYLSVKPIITAVNNIRVLVFAGLFALYLLLVIIARWASSLLLRQYRKLMEYTQVMQSRALTDELTGLNNRRYFEQQFAEEFRRALRYGRPLSIAMLDIDHFKLVNDKLGHQVGDEVLRKTAALINANLRNVDQAMRYGGEEFAIVMPETEGQSAMIVAERLRRAYITILKEYRSKDLPLTVSIGVAEYPSSAQTKEDVVAASDIALYYSKNKGRNRSSFFNKLPNKAKAINISDAS